MSIALENKIFSCLCASGCPTLPHVVTQGYQGDDARGSPGAGRTPVVLRAGVSLSREDHVVRPGGVLEYHDQRGHTAADLWP